MQSHAWRRLSRAQDRWSHSRLQQLERLRVSRVWLRRRGRRSPLLPPTISDLHACPRQRSALERSTPSAHAECLEVHVQQAAALCVLQIFITWIRVDLEEKGARPTAGGGSRPGCLGRSARGSAPHHPASAALRLTASRRPRNSASCRHKQPFRDSRSGVGSHSHILYRRQPVCLQYSIWRDTTLSFATRGGAWSGECLP